MAQAMTFSQPFSVTFLYTFKVIFYSYKNNPTMKLFQCNACHAVLRHESAKEEHSQIGSSHTSFREYELDEFLTRFLVAA